MKKSFIILNVIFIASCSFFEGKHVRKVVEKNGLRVEWYYEDRFRESTPDFISVIKDNQVETIYKATDVITDVKIKDHSIIIKTFEPYRGIVYTKNVKKAVFGYKVILDSASTYQEYLAIPN